jgi:DNA-directed RNA polymerase specialized sigma24 family protein
MANSSAPKPGRKTDWVLNQSAFRRLLDWLDEGANSDGSRYLEIRRRLVVYFDRKNCLTPEELADETLNRVARRLEEEGTITTDAPAHYCYIVARFVLLEDLRRDPQKPLDEYVVPFSYPTEHKLDAERRLECLEQCMKALDSNERSLIVNYYQGELRSKIENRKAAAQKLGVSMNALSIRACRIRAKLENCLQKCLKGAK